MQPPAIGWLKYDCMSTSASDNRGEEGSVLARLTRAADLVLRRDGVDNVSMEAVASEAGVSRATAFRQLGGRDQMIVTVALWRARRYADECIALMGQQVGAFAKLEAAFVYLVAALSNDAVVRELFALRPADDLGPGAHALAVATFGPAIDEGRSAGEFRTDVPVDDIVDWTTEQLISAVRQKDHSDEAVIRRVRMFLTPALADHRTGAVPSNIRSRIDTLESTLGQVMKALEALRAEVSPDDGGAPRATS
jgi:AcrR family transcriptional regulator